MSILVEQQDEQINTIEATAATVEKDTEAGLGYTEKAVDSARAARKKRWICFAILIVILIIVAIIIAVTVAQNKKYSPSRHLDPPPFDLEISLFLCFIHPYNGW